MVSKKLRKQIIDTEKQIQVEGEKNLDIVMCASIIALYRYYGWRTKRLSRLLEIHQEVWNEVAEDNSKSILKLLDEECGIELTNHEGVSYRDVIFLNSEIDDGRQLTGFQWLYMRQNQIKWIETQITGCVALAMHRKEGWGFERVKQLLLYIQDIKEEYDYDRRRLLDGCYRETGYDWEGKTLEEDQATT